MAGFDFRFRESGGAPTIRTIYAKDTETLTKGDLLNVETGEVDLAATADTKLIGIALETKAHTDSTTTTDVIVDADAVYGVVDANARKIGATLDITGATGAQTVTTSSNKDVVVVADSSATEETLVRIYPSRHALAGTAI
jgi:hypothetical protein